MTVYAYAESTSCAQGERLGFHLDHTSRAPLHGSVVVEDVASGLRVFDGVFDGPRWTLDIPGDWASSLYRAVFTASRELMPTSEPAASRELMPTSEPAASRELMPTSEPASEPAVETAEEGDCEVYFAVRAARPGSPILLSIPFPTWQAYNRAGIPGEGLYWAEHPTRAARVSFDRPGGGPPPERWEEGMIRWLGPAGYDVDYCSALDLHDGRELLAGYRLLVVNGHDEYWSAGMRDTVEEFVRRGGNLAVFSGNTCWWQFRLEDGGRTMVCYRDAAADPVAAVDPALTTVEWSSSPVDRPENSMIGVSFRRGAGTWGPYMQRMHEESYVVRFPEHWAFAGTGLGEGDKFGRGALGYETDACDFTEIDGVPAATGRDGTPPSFVILATADLRHWHRYGQGGMATMGTMRLGAGTVFTAATVNWGNALHERHVERITRNVLNRLSGPEDGWEVIGPAGPLRAMAVLGPVLYGADADGTLLARELSGQNLRWRQAGPAPGVSALAVPREATATRPVGLYGLTGDGRLVYREPDGSWTTLGDAPAGATGLALVNGELFAAASGTLWRRSEEDGSWDPVDALPAMTALTSANGRLYATDATGRVRTRLPLAAAAEWTDLCDAAGATVLTAHAGRLIATGPGLPLSWRACVSAPAS
ncbi:N,N-dimethylformamidase beta subunit family domain-containing protein [Planobispora rosea]|uniref:N,N-dimethylformamidase beta subunit family domain-containing protein n=1 Tax=Planobispora rosea TaxID=35762 RepID=UPI000B30AB21|nr:N,N-dimethylformamidase beta subunit family domain-containing protein [Planobispora rosea]